MSLANDLKVLGPKGNPKTIKLLADCAEEIMAEYEINTPLRVSHFWAQAAHECAGFRTMHEYWKPTPAQCRYEGRKDLGNVQPGDGYLFRGRGIFQLTGRANYETMGKKLGLDLVNNPDLAAQPEVALRIACEYWKSRKLNAMADKNDIEGITKKINGGLNGLSDRKAKFNLAWEAFADNFEKPKPAKTIMTSKEGNAAVVAGGAGAIAVAQEVIPLVKEGGSILSALSPSVLGLVVIVVAAAAIWYWRKQRLDADA